MSMTETGSLKNDPFAFLENTEDEIVRCFARQADAETRQTFEDDLFRSIRDEIAQAQQSESEIPSCREFHGTVYHFFRSEDFPKGVYRSCSAVSFRAGRPKWEILFSVAAFDEVLGEDVYFQDIEHYPPEPHKVLLFLSPGGTDAAYTIEFDLAGKTIVPGGFHFPPGKNTVSWRDADSVWVCPAWEGSRVTRSGYPAEVRVVSRASSFEEAQTVLSVSQDAVMVAAHRYRDGSGGTLDVVEAATGLFSKRYYQVLSDLSVRELGLPEDCELSGYLYGQLLVLLRSEWQRTRHRYRAGSLLAVKLNKGLLGSAQLLFSPGERQAADSVETTRSFVAAVILDRVSCGLKLWHYRRDVWEEVEAPVLPDGTLEISGQPWGGDVLYLMSEHFLRPVVLYALDLKQMELSVLRRQQPRFDAAGLRVRQFEAVSADGTGIPYYHVGRPQTGADVPTLVYVYGGFGVPLLPFYCAEIGRHWLQRGYAFVTAHVRGGGEFGVRWHEAGRKAGKTRSADDLLAVVQDLAARGLADPAYVGIQGGSNGGMVTAAAFCRNPGAVGALVSEVPLTDMLNYTSWSAGASWTDEYGDPGSETDRPALAALSPYHNLKADASAAPVLLTTTFTDDRVHPAHALKFYAELHAQNAPAWLAVAKAGGHAGGGTQEEGAAEIALILRFLLSVLAGVR